MIVYETTDGAVSVIIPNLSCGLSLDEIARKDVPAGRPYLFVNISDLPDLDYQEAFEADFSTPNGYGIGPEQWIKDLAESAVEDN